MPPTCLRARSPRGQWRSPTTVVGPGLINVDFSVFKNNYIETNSGSLNIQFRAEFFNIMNQANFQSPLNNSVLFNQDGSPVSGAGAIDATSTPARQIHLGLKVIW